MHSRINGWRKSKYQGNGDDFAVHGHLRAKSPFWRATVQPCERGRGSQTICPPTIRYLIGLAPSRNQINLYPQGQVSCARHFWEGSNTKCTGCRRDRPGLQPKLEKYGWRFSLCHRGVLTASNLSIWQELCWEIETTVEGAAEPAKDGVLAQKQILGWRGHIEYAVSKTGYTTW